jgi:hypothetical protein
VHEPIGQVVFLQGPQRQFGVRRIVFDQQDFGAVYPSREIPSVTT